MLIQYISDLHLEFTANQQWLNENPILPKGDILIIVGDTSYLGSDFGKLKLWNYLSKSFRQTYVLPGNHEYYGGYDVSTNLESTKEAIRRNVWLVNNYVVSLPEVRLIFATLWSRIERNVADILLGVNDFRRIRYQGKVIGVEHYNALHTTALQFLSSTLASESSVPTVVATHHLPSEQCNIPEFRDSTINEAFCVDLTEQIRTWPVAAWVYGHSHRNIAEFSIEGTQVLTNQLGYVHLGEHADFKPDTCLSL